MKYVHCPRCRARFHTGVIYEAIDECARCGGRLVPVGRWRDQLRGLLSRPGERLDWEAITGSQYVRRLASPAQRSHPAGSAWRRP